MPFTTYAELNTAIAGRLHRSDLTASIPDYITLAEKSLNRTLQLTNQELETTLTATIGSRSLTLPSGFARPLALYLTTYLPRTELEYRLPTSMQVYNSNGPSRLWTLDGDVINTDTPADIAYTYTLRYAKNYDLASTLANSLLTDYPDLYFYGALMEAADDVRDAQKLQDWSGRYGRAMSECLSDINSNKSIAPLTTEMSAQSKSNIISGV